MESNTNLPHDSEEQYRDILTRMENLVAELREIGTPEALAMIDEKTLQNIERIKVLLSKD